MAGETQALAAWITAHAPILILTGAGCSTASGIPAYRDQYGTWDKPAPIQHLDFLRSEAARRRYWGRSLVGWPRFAAARPNAAHRSIARLLETGFARSVVTQNVDRLHQKAGTASTLDLHGRLDRVVCVACGHRLARSDMQAQLSEINPDFDPACRGAAPDGDTALAPDATERLVVPDCPACGGILKPDVVFFGDAVPKPRVEQTLRRLNEAHGLLVIGSSLAVFSGYRYCRAAAGSGKALAIVNVGKTRADRQAQLRIARHCESLLPAVLQVLGVYDSVGSQRRPEGPPGAAIPAAASGTKPCRSN